MIRPIVALVIASAAIPALAQPTPASLEVAPAAKQLFERDWVLMNWALKFHDTNRDILLQPDEAEAAARAFCTRADADRDGRVTPQEFRSAREAILMGG